jgi:anti-sigma B factor antagonist
MTFSLSTENDTTVLRIEGELDAVTVTDLRPTIDRLATEGKKVVVVDLRSLRLIDSSGVGAIVSLYKRIRATGGSLSVRGLRDQPLAIFQLLRLDRILVA